jgi:hypothetical protein
LSQADPSIQLAAAVACCQSIAVLDTEQAGLVEQFRVFTPRLLEVLQAVVQQEDEDGARRSGRTWPFV